MTDKQIIINGIDVSGCDFLTKKDDYCSYSGVTYAYKGQCMCSDEEMCKEHPKCFYKKVLKQLKRKEQECEELKKEKEEIKKYLGISSKTIMQRLEELQERKDELIYREYKYKQSLNEIEEIAKNDCENCCECTTEFNIKESCSIYEIQNIINGVKDINVPHKAKDGE